MTLILFTVLFSFNSSAQNKSFDDVMEIELRNSGAIISSNEVTGYYFFYKVDKVSKTNSSYILRILDQNLNEVVKKELVEPTNIALQEVTYNGTGLALKFYDWSDAKNNKVVIKKFNTKGELEGSKSIPLVNAYEKMYYSSSNSTGQEIVSKNLFDIPGKGFVNYTPKKVNKMGFYIDFISTDPSAKDWTYKSSASSASNESATFFATSDNVIVSCVSKQIGGAMSKDFESFALGIDINTGKKLFETKIEDAKYDVVLMNGYTDKSKSEIVLVGQYYNKGDKSAKDASQGLCSYRIDNSGNITARNYISWVKDVSKVIPVNEKGKIDKVGFLFFHKIVQTADGRMYAIAESYKKAASAGGMAMAMLSKGGASAVKLVVEDMYIFEFTPGFGLHAVKSFDKFPTNVNGLPPGSGMLSAQLLGYVVKSLGGFDYSFTQMNEGNTVFHVGYTNFEKVKGSKNSYVFGAITYDAGNYKTDKLSLETEASSITVLPAKPGYVMVLEYFKKLKKIETRLEKINY